ncbi:MAG: zf-HC2 domain-containing protein [candidate division WOR-3 bacterium]
MTCERACELLSSYIDDELTTDNRTELEAHLQGCPSCATLERELRFLVRAANELEPIAPPDQLLGRIKSSIQRHRILPWVRPQTIGWVFGSALAAAALLLLLLPSKRLPRESQSSPSPLTVHGPTLDVQEPPEPIVLQPQLETDLQASPPSPRPRNRPSGSVKRHPTPKTQRPSSDLVLVADCEPNPLAQEDDISSLDVTACLRDLAAGLEEIEAALSANPGSPQVRYAYYTVYRKGSELRERLPEYSR